MRNLIKVNPAPGSCQIKAQVGKKHYPRTCFPDTEKQLNNKKVSVGGLVALFDPRDDERSPKEISNLCSKCILSNMENIFLTPSGRIPPALRNEKNDECYPFKPGVGFCELNHLGRLDDNDYYESVHPEGQILEFDHDYCHLTIHPCWGHAIMSMLSLWYREQYPAFDVENARIWLEDMKKKKFGRIEYGGIHDAVRYIPADTVDVMEVFKDE